MPTLRTEASEIAAAFGLLYIEPPFSLSAEQIQHCFGGTLSDEKYKSFKNEYQKNIRLHERMYRVGRSLREKNPLFSDISTLEWAGPTHQAVTASASQDLIVANTPISIKAMSNVVANPSPHNLFLNLPMGRVFSHNEPNWFITQDHIGFQELYNFIRTSRVNQLSYLPQNVEEFEALASAADRKLFQTIIREYAGEEKRDFLQHYITMCHAVAQNSADIFNSNISKSMKGRSRSAVSEYLIRWFFRLDSTSYVLCGIDKSEEFAVKIPSLAEWRREWEIRGITADASIQRRQSVVDFIIHFRNKSTKQTMDTSFHSEIRWSHGRFCGNPEGKLYKEFRWREVPFFEQLI